MADLLALDGNGDRLIPLVSGVCSSEEARSRLKRQKASDLFPRAYAPVAALGGLWVYFSCCDESHEIVQNVHSSEGSFWHAILHRQEPDAGNAAYWFRRAGNHAIFRDLYRVSQEVVTRHPEAEFHPSGKNWDPFAFVMFCERARQQPDSPSEHAALEIQRSEWQLLFDHCARSRS